jgi:hypothetical protein
MLLQSGHPGSGDGVKDTQDTCQELMGAGRKDQGKVRAATGTTAGSDPRGDMTSLRLKVIPDSCVRGPHRWKAEVGG